MSQTINWKLINKVLTDTASDAERADFMSWLQEDSDHALIYQDLHDHYHRYDDQKGFDPSIAFEKWKSSQQKFQTPLTVPFPWRKVAAAVALVMMLGLGAYFSNDLKNLLMTPNFTEIAVPAGQQRHIRLADGTEVWINTESVLSFPEKFESEVREVRLTGEAFFDVAKDAKRPFIVHTSSLDLKVLGTSFNVDSRQNREEVEVALLTGKLEVKEINTQEAVVLTPNERINYQKTSQQLVKSIIEHPVTYKAWTDDDIHFEATPMLEVIKALERKYLVEIKVANQQILNCTLTANFQEHSLKHTLQLLAESTGFHYEREGKQIRLMGEGCPNNH